MNPNAIKVAKAELFQYVSPVKDIAASVASICDPLKNSVLPGMRIAIGVGSRGVANIAIITKVVVDFIKDLGAFPFIVPAMGSHGGATALGQKNLLKEYSITEETMGVEICSSMEVEQIAFIEGEESFPIFFDKYALAADGVVVINRVKAHTDFHGIHESGIVKMLVIGLGKHKQAVTMHRFGAEGLQRLIPIASKAVLEKMNILGGIAVLEDGADNTSEVVFALPQDFFEVDRNLLIRSKEIMAKLPFDEIDVLVIDEMGKDISGTGMDTNVIGRIRIEGQEDLGVNCKRIVCLDLTEPSHGNATGIGLADVVTKRLVDKVDKQVTDENVITSGFYERGFIPLVVEDDAKAIAVASIGNFDENTIKLARIKNTLDLTTIYLSKSLMDQLLHQQKGKQLTDYKPMSFTDGVIEKF